MMIHSVMYMYHQTDLLQKAPELNIASLNAFLSVTNVGGEKKS